MSVKNQTSYSEEFKLKAVKMYEKNPNFTQVAKQLNVNPTTLSVWVKKYSTTLFVEKEYDETYMRQIVKRYEECRNFTHVSQEAGISTDKIRKWALHYGTDESKANLTTKRYTKAEKQQIIKKYEVHLDREKIKKEYNISEHTLVRWIKNFSKLQVKPAKLTDLKKKQILELYEKEALNIYEIMAQLSLSDSAVRKHLAKESSLYNYEVKFSKKIRNEIVKKVIDKDIPIKNILNEYKISEITYSRFETAYILTYNKVIERRKNIIADYHEDKDIKQIAENYNIHSDSVRRILKEYSDTEFEALKIDEEKKQEILYLFEQKSYRPTDLAKKLNISKNTIFYHLNISSQLYVKESQYSQKLRNKIAYEYVVAELNEQYLLFNYQISKVTLERFIKTYKKRKPSQILSQEQKIEIAQKYDGGASQPELAEKYQISIITIRHILQKYSDRFTPEKRYGTKFKEFILNEYKTEKISETELALKYQIHPKTLNEWIAFENKRIKIEDIT